MNRQEIKNFSVFFGYETGNTEMKLKIWKLEIEKAKKFNFVKKEGFGKIVLKNWMKVKFNKSVWDRWKKNLRSWCGQQKMLATKKLILKVSRQDGRFKIAKKRLRFLSPKRSRSFSFRSFLLFVSDHRRS